MMDHSTSRNRQKDTFGVTGMTCASCAVSLESWLKNKEGVIDVSVNYPNEAVSVTYDPNQIDPQQLDKAAHEIGYGLVLGDAEHRESQREEHTGARLRTLRWKLVVAVLFALPVFIISMFFSGEWAYQNVLLLFLSVPVVTWSGSEFYVNAWKQASKARMNMDTLVALSTGVALIFSIFNTFYPEFLESRSVEAHVYYESAVVIITLILLGRYLEEGAKRKTSGAIRELMNLRPKKVTLIRNGEQVEVSLSEVSVGDLIVLKPGEKVPVDGKVKSGESYVDESAISGEPLPVHKTKGASLYTGTINQKGSLKLLAEKVGADTLLAQIIRTVQDAQASKPPIQYTVDRIAGIFVPVVIVIAVLAAVIWYFVAPSEPFSYAMVILISVLIIACPCALGLATPTAIMVGIGKAAEAGLLIKNAEVLQEARKVDTVIFDKTGTLTEGRPKVTDARILIDKPAREVYSLLYSIESSSEHPLAGSIADYAKNLGGERIELNRFESISGKGVSAQVDGKKYLIGLPEWTVAEGVNLSPETRALISEWRRLGRTVVMLSSGSNEWCLLSVEDAVKPSAKEAVSTLKEMGIDVHLLSGDNRETALTVAKGLGISEVRAGVMPSEKGDYVRRLREEGRVVAMVGDGINDAEALALADVGIAMGSGTDIAMESAGVTVMGADPKKVPAVVVISRETVKTLNQNLFWAFIYNVVAIPVAAGVLYPFLGWLLSPMIAGGAMAMSSVSVVLNSLFLRNRIHSK